MKRILTIAIMAILCTIASAQVQNTDVVLINNPGDGSLVVRANGNGRNRVIARKDAIQVALRTIIFKGVHVPGSPNLSKPLIMDMNGETKYEDFFNDFFSDRGNYMMFVDRHKDRKFISNRVKQHGVQTSNQVTLRVERAELKAFLKEKGIIE